MVSSFNGTSFSLHLGFISEALVGFVFKWQSHLFLLLLHNMATWPEHSCINICRKSLPKRVEVITMANKGFRWGVQQAHESLVLRFPQTFSHIVLFLFKPTHYFLLKSIPIYTRRGFTLYHYHPHYGNKNLPTLTNCWFLHDPKSNTPLIKMFHVQVCNDF